MVSLISINIHHPAILIHFYQWTAFPMMCFSAIPTREEGSAAFAADVAAIAKDCA